MSTTTAPPLSAADSSTVAPLRIEDELPTNVHTVEQLQQLPDECLSNVNKDRPLRHVDLKGNEFTYSLNPIQYSVGLILVVELMERFAYYSVYVSFYTHWHGQRFRQREFANKTCDIGNFWCV